MISLYLYSDRVEAYQEAIEVVKEFISKARSRGEIRRLKRIMKQYKRCIQAINEVNHFIRKNRNEPFSTITSISNKKYEKNRLIAKYLYAIGNRDYSFSSGICGLTTAGYGRCDEYGYFEYPLTVDQDTYEIK
jgi:hypothetical protein